MLWFTEDLNEYEIALLRHSAAGDLKEIQNIFVQQTYYLFELNVNCVDYLDRTALSLAILHRHLDVVKFLLGEEIGKCYRIHRYEIKLFVKIMCLTILYSARNVTACVLIL